MWDLNPIPFVFCRLDVLPLSTSLLPIKIFVKNIGLIFSYDSFYITEPILLGGFRTDIHYSKRGGGGVDFGIELKIVKVRVPHV
jgi:hypothetical protein